MPDFETRHLPHYDDKPENCADCGRPGYIHGEPCARCRNRAQRDRERHYDAQQQASRLLNDVSRHMVQLCDEKAALQDRVWDLEEQLSSQALQDVLAERERQDEKWGEQNHPIVHPSKIKLLKERMAYWIGGAYGIPSARGARYRCENNARQNRVDWIDILVEEVCESVEAGAVSAEEARKELVQVAAVALAAIECIDRGGVNG